MTSSSSGRRVRLAFNSPAVLGFSGICLLAMVLNQLTGGQSNRLLFSVYRAPLTNPLTWLRMVCHVFGHADWNHLLNNMMYILLLGPMLEEKYGSAKILEVILTTALVTALLNYFLFPGIALCGASGVVFAFILLTSFTGFNEGEIPLTVILVAIIFIGQQVYEGVFLQDNVSNLSHIAGGIVGAVIGYQLNKRTNKRY